MFTRILSAVLFVSLSAPFGAWGQGSGTQTLRSPVLRLEVTPNPYSYRLIEGSTGTVLLAHRSLALTDQHFAATSASGFEHSAKSLSMNVALAGTANRASVTFTFVQPQVLRVLVTYTGGDAGVVTEMFTDQGEHNYGIWEYNGENMDNRGTDKDFLGIRARDNAMNVLYSNARAPFYFTSRKYGIYVETTGQGHYQIAKDGQTGFSFHDSRLQYDILYGPGYADILKRYNALAGPAFTPPDWALGSYWWRDDHHDDLRAVQNAQGKVIDDADRLQKLHIPASVMWLDRPSGTGTMGWGNMDFDKSFPDPAGMVRELKARGMYLLIWIANRNWNQLYQEGSAKGYLFPGPAADGPAIDVRNAGAYQWFKSELGKYVKLGVRGYKIDRGEQGEMPDAVQNLNAILFPKLAAESLSAAYGKDFIMLTRNVNDTGRKYTGIWNGDTRPTFAGLAISVKTAQRAGAIDFPVWGSDTGGYLGRPNEELFARWLEFSTYTPIMEVLNGPKRTIWDDFDDKLIDIARNAAVTHHDLIPYTRSYLHQAAENGMPLVRSLVFAFPNDETLNGVWDEYLYGGEILVAPVVTAGATQREVYLPAGEWLDYNNKSSIHRAGRVTVEAPLDRIPLFVRAGAIVPRGDILKANNNWTPNWTPKLHVEMFPSSKVRSRFDYFTGQRIEPIAASVSRAGISVNFGDLGTRGDLEIYCRNVKGVVRNGSRLRRGADYQYDQASRKLTVPFQGATRLTLEGATGLFE
ncbi:MAG TPA: TIM-barrel domain-containing protein [Bryobacteraceae bacterium]|nr:TIM-barrel domain-containing protein [Bryobacteraceae bacterium]